MGATESDRIRSEGAASPGLRCEVLKQYFGHIPRPFGTHERDEEPFPRVSILENQGTCPVSSILQALSDQILTKPKDFSAFSLSPLLCNCVRLLFASKDRSNVLPAFLCCYNAGTKALAAPRKDPVSSCSLRAAYVWSSFPSPQGDGVFLEANTLQLHETTAHQGARRRNREVTIERVPCPWDAGLTGRGGEQREETDFNVRLTRVYYTHQRLK